MVNIIDLYQVNTMRKRKGIRILYVAHLFKCRGRKPRKKSVSRLTISRRVGWRRQAKRRCLWVGIIIALTAWSTSLRSRIGLPSERNSARRRGRALHFFGCTARELATQIEQTQKTRAQAKKHPHARIKELNQ